MKKKGKIKFRKMIGKNCMYNYLPDSWYCKSFQVSKKIHRCSINDKRCGLKHKCDCFDDKGKLQFQAKEENHEKI